MVPWGAPLVGRFGKKHETEQDLNQKRLFHLSRTKILEVLYVTKIQTLLQLPPGTSTSDVKFDFKKNTFFKFFFKFLFKSMKKNKHIFFKSM